MYRTLTYVSIQTLPAWICTHKNETQNLRESDPIVVIYLEDWREGVSVSVPFFFLYPHDGTWDIMGQLSKWKCRLKKEEEEKEEDKEEEEEERKRKRKKKGFSTAEAQDSESGHLSFATETRHFVLQW